MEAVKKQFTEQVRTFPRYYFDRVLIRVYNELLKTNPIKTWQMSHHTPVISATRRLRQENHKEFEANLCCVSGFKHGLHYIQDCVSNKKICTESSILITYAIHAFALFSMANCIEFPCLFAIPVSFLSRQNLGTGVKLEKRNVSQRI